MIPTSNHNSLTSCPDSRALYIFWFLHQTTTSLLLVKTCRCCISFDSYIKPQLQTANATISLRCISFDSYIKPQLKIVALCGSSVVYLLIPTSNHNDGIVRSKNYQVVYLLIPTSNHNCNPPSPWYEKLYIFWFLHQTTTLSYKRLSTARCISFDSYIKPQLLLI